jgi:GT2 family glycosyltransferase
VSNSGKPIKITAIVTAFRRVEQTLVTLEKIYACHPCPDEVLVHVDAGGDECRNAVASNFPRARLLTSETPVGPGGARNKLIAAARNEIVASFDDDSFPVDTDYFARLERLFGAHPDAAVITANIFTRQDTIMPSQDKVVPIASFVGCGCAYRKSKFLNISGYVPLLVAYGMEELDVALQLHAKGERIYKANSLRVFHDTDYSGHISPKLVSGTIANAALLAFLRYPLIYWPLGCIQVMSVVWYAVKNRRYHGIISGLLMIPRYIYKHRSYRSPVSIKLLRGFVRLRRNKA